MGGDVENLYPVLFVDYYHVVFWFIASIKRLDVISQIALICNGIQITSLFILRVAFINFSVSFYRLIFLY